MTDIFVLKKINLTIEIKSNYKFFTGSNSKNYLGIY